MRYDYDVGIQLPSSPLSAAMESILSVTSLMASISAMKIARYPLFQKEREERGRFLVVGSISKGK